MRLRAGEFAVVSVDLVYVQDGTGPLMLRQMEKLGFKGVSTPERAMVFLDHASPSPRQELSNDHKMLREFCQRTGCNSFRRWQRHIPQCYQVKNT